MNIQGLPFKVAAGDGGNLLHTKLWSKVWASFVVVVVVLKKIEMWGRRGREGGRREPSIKQGRVVGSRPPSKVSEV